MAAVQLHPATVQVHSRFFPQIRQPGMLGLRRNYQVSSSKGKATSARGINTRKLSFSVSAIAHPAAGGRNWNTNSTETTVDLCIFPMWSMPLPTSTGTLNVFEPHLVALLQVVQQVAAASLDNIPARFGTLPYDWVQHQMWLEDTVVPPSLAYLGDTPPAAFGELTASDGEIVGVSCDIQSVLEEPSGNGSLVQYQATRRFKPTQILRRKPFLVVRGLWLEDDRARPSAFHNGRSTDELEQDLWREIQEVVKYTARLEGKGELPSCGGPDAALPETVCKLSPTAPPKPTTAEERVRALAANRASRMPSEVAVWRNMRSATAVASKSMRGVEAAMADPYLAAGEKISKAARQEAFSFAAATIVELGPEQKQELLSMTSTALRLHWLLKAIEPHLGILKTEYSMRQALGDL